MGEAPENSDAVPAVALVTGAASGIGLACANRLAADGFRVVFADNDGPAAARAAQAHQSSAIHVEMDVTDEVSVSSGFQHAHRALGPVAVLVTCAGVMATSAAAASIATMTADVWERTFAVNALGTFLCVREFLRRYAEQAVPAGRIVTMSSAAAQIGGYRGDAAYIASKAAVIGFTKIAARQAAAAGITVNCVAAGPVATPMFDRAMDEASLPGLLDRIPAGRIGQPAEIAALVAHLAGQDAGFITGATFDVNGGYSMR